MKRAEDSMGITNLILMPVAYNDGQLVPDEVFDRLLLRLAVKFGGFTWLPPAFGGWIDTEGKFQPDKHRPLFVHVEEGQEEALEDWIRMAGRELGQDVMLLLRDFCRAVFIEIETEPW